jgi:Lectin like domain/Papain family cysteine protease
MGTMGMRSQLHKIQTTLLVALLSIPLSATAELQIESFQSGELTWSGATPGTTNWIQWAPALTDSNAWHPFQSVRADSTVMTIEVPCAYRIMETPPTNPLPARFDAREQGWVTPVKSQIGNRANGDPDPGNSVGICWAMSAMSVFESSLLKQGLTTDPDSPDSSFSPWHLGNAVGHPPLDYNEPCYTYHGDPIDFGLYETDPLTVFGYLSPEGTNGWGGGHVFWLLDSFLCWTGPVHEADSPVPVEAMTAHETLVWSNPSPPVADFILQGAYRFYPEDYATQAEFHTAAKQAILNYGSIQTYMLVLPADFPDVEGLSFYDTNSFCIYNPRGNLEPQLNHAISVIGWNDEYPASGAPATGAWLIKESLGTQVYSNGYHWIAYEDQTFLRDDDMFYAVVAADGAGYQWPGLMTHPGAMTRHKMMATDFLTIGSSMWGQDSQGFAVFRSVGGGALQSIGWVTVNRNEEVDIDIYGGMDAQHNPTNLLGSQTAILDERGYHLVDLDPPISIPPGNDLIVSLTFAYQDQDEPMVYVSDTNLPPAETYTRTYTATNPTPVWSAVTERGDDGSLFIQAVFTEAD